MYCTIVLKGGINIKSTEAEMIAREAKNGNWGKIIRLQTNSHRESYQAEILKRVLYTLSKDRKLSSELIENETMHLVVLFRYFGTKPLNNGFYFKEKEDAENFIEQYRKMMKLYPYLEREKGEKIAIIEMRLCQKKEVL